ncbi:zinc fingers and homeoboxes protein 3 isoform X1 [Syngnathus typhle]|uniref:zinc fingers and homeoboxes protein 3 isoform X1 n=1 Tax=Syngnathus typhle TaxID=161592 RepID=UPI002A69DB91|nr:zinc fingers and homeoboxes protein 3 isoform X1 [Syngnathus typhle]XP_061120674.1 zinc fingers and homeoboxes protein 3 isoform X1 [Syngnathus typhle]
MASKRKSTIPCMIPSKIIRHFEDVEADIPVLQRQTTISGGSGRRSPPDLALSPKLETADPVVDDAGTYICKPCNFETYDLNLFLDHVYAGHPEFRSDPSFLCVNCGFSALKFEGLALHNARIHPSTFNCPLQLRRRDRRAVVEQTIATESDEGKDNEISITKTPIMKMLKGKSELKRIVMSQPSSDAHSLSGSKEPEKKETVTVAQGAHVPTVVYNNGATKVTLPSAIQIVNGSGALPVLKTPIAQVLSVQNKGLHQSSLTAVSTDASSSKNLPKVMIPLSSIPTYNASMDSSSFLKTSFSKFPYPTKAELCYLTVVTKFPEEQIKIWFTAQRLKQGISWSPEEIEEARRKMFNTVIQTASTSAHNQPQSQAPHTITVLGATGIPQILQGSLISQGGVIVTQPMMANGIQVNGTPVALAVTPKPQAAARPTMQARPAAAPVADKRAGILVGSVASGSSGTNVIGSSKSSRSGGASASNVISSTTQASVINLTLGSNNHGNAKVSSGNVKCHSNGKSKSDVSKSAYHTKVGADGKSANGSSSSTNDSNGQKSKNTGSGGNKNDAGADDADPSTSNSFKMDDASSPSSKSSSPSPVAGGSRGINTFLDPGFCKGKKSQEQLGTLKDSFLNNAYPDQEEVDRLISLTGLTVREVRKWFSDRRYHLRNLKGPRSGPGGPNKSSSGNGAAAGDEGSPGPIDLSENGGAKTPQHSSAPLSPTSTHTPTSPSTPSRKLPRSPSPDFTIVRYKEREPHQIKALEASFAQAAEPSGEEVDRLRSETKMTRREIHNWFTERRKKAAASERRKEETARASGAGAEANGDEGLNDDISGELKVNPIKINLKMLKVTEANGKPEDELADGHGASTQSSVSMNPAPTPAVKGAVLRGKKTAEQLHLLKRVYARTQWPSAAQYDELISGTGLPRPDVVRWFGDCRYMQKNSQLKWLEAYQNTALDEDLHQDNERFLQAHLDSCGGQEESQLQELAKVTGLTTDLVRHWLATKESAARAERVSTSKPAAGIAAAEPPPLGPSPLEPHPRGSNEKIEQSLCGQAGEGNTHKTTKGAD